MDEDEIKFPLKSDDLLEILNKSFPQITPVLGMSENEIWYRAGQRSLIDWLIELKYRDENNNED